MKVQVRCQIPLHSLPARCSPRRSVPGGSVKIVDRRNFPVTNIAAAIVTLKPGGLRELHWHPNDDEWQYYVKGQGRMTVFSAGGQARTMDFREGDVGYVERSMPHYIENLGDTDLVFLEVFPTPDYQDILACGVAGARSFTFGRSAHPDWRGLPAQDFQERNGDHTGIATREQNNWGTARRPRRMMVGAVGLEPTTPCL